MQRIAFTLGLAACLAACAPAASSPAAVRLDVYVPPSASPWLEEAFECTEGQGAALSVTNDPAKADLQLRIGEMPGLASTTYQIDTEELLIVTHRESPVQNLTLEAARELFAGRGDASVQVWVYAPGDDIQRLFDRLVMKGSAITSLARLAVSPQGMSDMLNAERTAVGILPRHWMAGTVREVFSAGTVPVLAVTPSEPEGALAALVACLQK